MHCVTIFVHIFFENKYNFHLFIFFLLFFRNTLKFDILNREISNFWVLINIWYVLYLLFYLFYLSSTDFIVIVLLQVATGTGIMSHFVNVHIVVPEAFILGSGEHHVDVGSGISLVCIIEKVSTKFSIFFIIIKLYFIRVILLYTFKYRLFIHYYYQNITKTKLFGNY